MIDAVIVGSGPYGLSIGAHFRQGGIRFRIFGRAMDSWLSHMPQGMLLKSEGFASNLYGPANDFKLSAYCAQNGIPYADLGRPVPLQTFASYGLAFRDKHVPELEEKLVTRISQSPNGYEVQLDTGESLTAKRVIIAVGITHFAYLPDKLAHMPKEFLTHSFEHSDLERFRNRRVAVIGSGASATDLAALLLESGADVHLIARDAVLKFHSKMVERSLWEKIRIPNSGIGQGLKSRLYADAPNLFRYLSEETRLRIVRSHLGPAGGWSMKDRVIGKVPTLLGSTVSSARIADGRVLLQLQNANGDISTLAADHVIAATGYKADIRRLYFLDPELSRQIRAVHSTPVLSSNFESSVSGLHFVGLTSANSFGPVMRFAFGARFAARRLTGFFSKSSAMRRSVIAVPAVSSSSRAISREAR
jgi:Pyridine nucleotide-disulphide oxidoreductase